ncbi:MAG: hypothetical protein CMH83_02955 [Nocardioides sp.]|nr:hypothetical protein [Nocardioides sp.]
MSLRPATAPHLDPGPDHPITVEPTGRRVVVRAGGTVVATSDRTRTLREASYAPVVYVPLADVDPGVLRRTDTTTYCPFKGVASYWTLVLGSGDLVDAVWGYEAPFPGVLDIAGHVAFVADRVDVEIG